MIEIDKISGIRDYYSAFNRR